MGLAQGLSLVRAVLRVDMTALMGSDGGALANAVDMSVEDRGVPGTMDRLARGGRASGRRTRAVIVCLRARASATAREPVRPVAPRRRMRIACVWRWLVLIVGFFDVLRMYVLKLIFDSFST